MSTTITNNNKLLATHAPLPQSASLTHRPDGVVDVDAVHSGENEQFRQK